ncbi:MAG TPA: hypothetical protein VFV27_03585 [Nevskiaceae bacterium]|nr:hypothetical protein [Nevskiaceae bacterium]
MTLTRRKWLYALLGSGAIPGALMASTGFYAVLAAAETLTPTVAALSLLFGAGLLGPICGAVAILALPVRSRLLRGLLSAGMILGMLPALWISWGALGNGRPADLGVMAYVALLPVLVGLVVLAELWRAPKTGAPA